MYFSDKYIKNGVDNFYLNSSRYKNPHEPIIQKIVRKYCSEYKSVLDLSCGSGEVTLALNLNSCEVEGADPYLGHLYASRTGKICHALSYKEIALHGLDRGYEAVICSFAMHLCPDSWMPQLLWQLSLKSEYLVIISPTKKPQIKSDPWHLIETDLVDRVHYRKYGRNKV